MAKDPLAALDAIPRKILPTHLRGKAKADWETFVKRYKEGKYLGLKLKQLHMWAQTELGCDCSIYGFKRALLDATGLEELL